MEKLTQEQIKEFWGWYGFKPMTLDELPDVMRNSKSNLLNRYMFTSTDNHKMEHYGLPIIDLNNLFKYAKPVYIQKYGAVDWSMILRKWAVFMKDNPEYDSAIALFWIIWQRDYILDREN